MKGRAALYIDEIDNLDGSHGRREVFGSVGVYPAHHGGRTGNSFLLRKGAILWIFFTLAKNRYSVRKFSERSVEPEKLEKVLEAARVAPTAHNYQPFRIYVLKSKDAIAKIRELTPCAFNARSFLW